MSFVVDSEEVEIAPRVAGASAAYCNVASVDLASPPVPTWRAEGEAALGYNRRAFLFHRADLANQVEAASAMSQQVSLAAGIAAPPRLQPLRALRIRGSAERMFVESGSGVRHRHHRHLPTAPRCQPDRQKARSIEVADRTRAA